ncbi:MAG: endo-1,4-beta-xylanase [Lachnospiraceae bacterium]|nr:endo-1,4-beta-xylanase [Lachnospiraceae bacterium]
MVRKCKRFLMLALTALLVCNEIVVVEASGAGQVTVVEDVQQENEEKENNETEGMSLTAQEEELVESEQTKGKEEVTTEAEVEDEAEVDTETESEINTEAETTTEEETETEVETETEAEAETEVETETEAETITEETTEELTTEELTEIEENGTALAMAIDEGENYATYAAAGLEQVVVWGAETVENEDGSVQFTFPKQYDQLCFKIPEDVDKSKLAKIIVNTNDDASSLAIKILNSDGLAADGSNEAAVAYGTSSIDVSEELTVDDLKCFGLMGLADEYKITIDSITFEYGEGKRGEQNTQSENEFTFDQLEVVAEHSVTKEITETGALKASYEAQWGEIRFAVPESVDVTKIDRLIVNLNSGDASKLSLKFLSGYDFSATDIELAAGYETTVLGTGKVDNREDIKYFGIMAMADDVNVEIANVVFEMDEGSAGGTITGIQHEVPDLRDAVAEKTDSKFITGVSITNDEISDEYLMALVTKHFNAVTLGNELKPDCLFGYSSKCPEKETITFNGVEMEVPTLDYSKPEMMLDAILEWNENNPDDFISVRGHVLVWHSQTPEWFFCKDYDVDNGYVDKDTMTLRQEWFIKTVLEHFTGEDSKYKDLFYGWDVVNEAVSDGRGTYRNGDENSTWWKVYGSNEFIINAFRFANKYAPADVELYYNDYNEWVSSKVDGIVQLLKDVKNAEGTRIDGMGMQGHYGTDSSPAIEDIKKAARAYAEVVGKIQITELDLKASNAYDGTSATRDAEYTKQAYRYKDIYDAIIELRAEGVNLSNMTIWGVIDKNSWLQTSNSVGGASDGRKKQCPLLFDDYYQVKPAYWAFVDETKLEPEIKSFDISQVVDDAFTASTSLEVKAGSAQMTVSPVWDKDGIHVLAKVKDATVDDTDAVAVYTSINGDIKKVEAARKDGTATDDGYEVVLDVVCDEAAMHITSEFLIDFVLTDGATSKPYNDYTMNQEQSDKYFAKACLKPYIMIPKGTVTVDGTREEAWDKAVEVPLTIDLGSNVEANARLVWDEDYLYAYVDVTDAVLNSDSANAHEKDSLELFIDENNHKSTSYEEDDKQYRINYLNEHSFNGTKCLEENMKAATTKTDKGYAIEAAFAWTDIEPAADMKIGLELQINDADDSGKRIGTLSWYDTSGNGWSSPEVFGTAILVDGNEEDNTPVQPEPEDKPDTPVDPKPEDKPDTGNSSSETQNNGGSTTTVTQTTKLQTITDSKVPLAPSIVDENDTSVSIVFSEKKALLRQSLLSKYYGKVYTFMAHLGNGIGFSMDANAIGGKDVDLSATLQVVEQFADGFQSFKMNTQQNTVLNGELGIHVNVGVQYAGLQAYIFQKNITTGLYELKNTMPVNEIGNVAVMTNTVADMYILIAK